MNQRSREDAPTDASLVLLARQGNDRAFRLLVERYTPLVASLLHHRLSDHRDVEDEIQETFLKAHSCLATLDDPRRLSSWLARIAVNRAHTRARQLSGRRETPSGSIEMLDQVTRHEVWVWQYGVSWLVGREALRSGLDALPRSCRGPLLMWAVQGCSYVEVAEELGVSEKVASRRVRRGRDLLKSMAGLAR